MNSRISTLVAKFISLVLILAFPLLASADWAVDFSRRTNQMKSSAPMQDEMTQKVEEQSLFDRVFNTTLPVQEIVILNTEQGFLPSTVRVRENAQYRIVVVNVNEKARNVSFVLDSFSEHHATYYGKLKSFYINPKKEGVYTFLSPETSAQGRLVVHPAADGKIDSQKGVSARLPASE